MDLAIHCGSCGALNEFNLSSPEVTVKKTTFTVTGGTHVECGSGPVVQIEEDGGARCRCESCGAEETWEQAARAMKKELNVIVAQLPRLWKLEEGIDAFIAHLKRGYRQGF